jgi:small subunit ribosomal protein S6
MMNNYETVFILTPVLSEQQTKEAVAKFSAFISENGAEIVHEDYWGLRKLAYPIQNKSTGFYHLIEFKSPGTLIDRLETEYRRDERIIRFLTFRMDKYAVQYSQKRRSVPKDDKNVTTDKPEKTDKTVNNDLDTPKA